MMGADGRSYVGGPSAARTGAPGHWPDAWREAWIEREAIAWEGGAADPAAVADAEVDDAIAAGDM